MVHGNDPWQCVLWQSLLSLIGVVVVVVIMVIALVVVIIVIALIMVVIVVIVDVDIGHLLQCGVVVAVDMLSNRKTFQALSVTPQGLTTPQHRLPPSHRGRTTPMRTTTTTVQQAVMTTMATHDGNWQQDHHN